MRRLEQVGVKAELLETKKDASDAGGEHDDAVKTII